jgi:hypothetical protein
MGNKISGYTVELFRQPGGNLDVMSISASQFAAGVGLGVAQR